MTKKHSLKKTDLPSAKRQKKEPIFLVVYSSGEDASSGYGPHVIAIPKSKLTAHQVADLETIGEWNRNKKTCEGIGEKPDSKEEKLYARVVGFEHADERDEKEDGITPDGWLFQFQLKYDHPGPEWNPSWNVEKIIRVNSFV